jgi:hypothetical protein
MRASIIHRAVEAVNLQVLAQVLQVAFFASFATPLRILRLRALKLLTAKGRKVKSPRSRTAPPLFFAQALQRSTRASQASIRDQRAGPSTSRHCQKKKMHSEG